MRAHAAFYEFATECGTLGGKDHAREWKQEDDDSRWLSSREGVRLRGLWTELAEVERAERMLRTPDSSYHGPVLGITDNRTRESTRQKKKAIPKVPDIAADIEHNNLIPASVPELEKARLLYVNDQQKKAFAATQIGFKTKDYTTMAVGLADFFRHVGAEILLKLPAEHRATVADVLDFRIQLVKSFTSAADAESLDDLQERFAVYSEAVQRSSEVYSRAASDAIEACTAQRLPDPDPRLPSNLLSRGPDHPTYRDVGVSSQVAASSCIPQIQSELTQIPNPANAPPAHSPTQALSVSAQERPSPPQQLSTAPARSRALLSAQLLQPPPSRLATPEVVGAAIARTLSRSIPPHTSPPLPSSQEPPDIALRVQKRRRVAATVADARLALATADEARQNAIEARNRAPSNMIPEIVHSGDEDSDAENSDEGDDDDTVRQLHEAQERTTRGI